MPECGRFDAYCRLVFQASAKIEGAQNFEDPIAKCIYCAIKMSLRDCYPAYKFLGLDVLREGYRLGKYREGQSQRHIAIGSLVKSTEPLYRERSRHLDNEFFQAEHFIRMYMYTVIRTVYALCPNEKRWLLRINFPVGVLLDVFLPTKTLLFRALYTLLKLEWKARYLSVRYDYAPSYWLFANLMSKYDFNCEELANDLMPFETDGMQYILAFVSRVLSSRWEPRTNTSDGPPYYMPPDFISRYGQEIRQLFITIAQKLEATYIELGMSPEEYPNTIYHLREAAGKLP
ncbi:unnamed protein product [Rodentolepis nana]|uniref:Mab-21 domain-containing protein n=1 Tax=Rodentolepis nana TaxID=102285 RepID=A0A0R3TAD8_RODNA|nr:unnamed protein product [Rodentolepis nana]